MERSEWVEGLRALADLIEKDDDFPVPFYGQGRILGIPLAGYSKDHVIKVATTLKNVQKEYEGDRFGVSGQVGPLWLEINTSRQQVCEKRVVGTQQVVKEVTDPDAPKVRMVIEEDVVEWDCHPLLAPTPSQPVPELADEPF